MPDHRQILYTQEEINLSEYFSLFRKVWWKVFVLSLMVGLITFLVMLFMPNVYRSTAVIAPTPEKDVQTPSLGYLASSLMLQIGGPSEIKDLEALFKSKDLTVRVFKKYNLWPIVFSQDFDPNTGKMKINWIDRMNGATGDWKYPDDWDAIRTADKYLMISVNNKMGTLSISFYSPSAVGSANIVKYYLEEVKNRLQEEALKRASNNKKFIKDQISEIVDPLTRDRLYTLYGQEVEREMMARNREHFGFTVIDLPRPADRKYKPRRLITAFAVTIFSCPLLFMCYIFLRRRKKISD